MLHLISYDVIEDARRRRVFETLKDYGRRVQYSVFECDLDEAGLTELVQRLEEAIDPERDSCRIYRQCGACEGQVRILGQADRREERGFVVI